MSKVILFRGRPGVGKTTITNHISRKLAIPVIRKDDFYDEASFYIEEHDSRNKVSYGILYRMLETNAASKTNFILDFPFNQKADVMRFMDWVTVKGFEFKPVLCICSDERTWAERFNRRKIDPQPNQLITDFNELKRYYVDLTIEPLEHELVIDTIETIESNAINILSYIE